MVVTNYFKKWWLIQILVLCPCQPKCRTGSDRGSNSIKKVTTIENIDHKQYNRLYLWWLSLKKLMLILNTIAAIINSNCERRYLQPCQTYKKECFSIKQLTISANRSILDVWQGSEYAFDSYWNSKMKQIRLRNKFETRQ